MQSEKRLKYTIVTSGFCNHFANIVGCRCEFYVGTLHCKFTPYEFWPYKFPARTTNRTFLNLFAPPPPPTPEFGQINSYGYPSV